ncbi:MAG TPA: hypothetical protein VLG71_01685 [Candidatus Limnocylindria bacterium]|nr:hypothetical protein [Candidatus Limnocylindria bacterium]
MKLGYTGTLLGLLVTMGGMRGAAAAVAVVAPKPMQPCHYALVQGTVFSSRVLPYSGPLPSRPLTPVASREPSPIVVNNGGSNAQNASK